MKRDIALLGHTSTQAAQPLQSSSMMIIGILFTFGEAISVTFQPIPHGVEFFS
jgi:high-affinity nickel permease